MDENTRSILVLAITTIGTIAVAYLKTRTPKSKPPAEPSSTGEDYS